MVASVVTAHAAGSEVRLIDAVKAGNRDVVRALVGQRVDVNAREADGTTALHWAVRADDADMATSLIASRRRGQRRQSLRRDAALAGRDQRQCRR